MIRNIRLCLPDGFIDKFKSDDLTRVVGYLTTWGLDDTIKNVDINGFEFGRDAGCLEASYRDKDGKQTFYMFAFREPDGHYTTHS